jgi:SAM-dependent methyltransferase
VYALDIDPAMIDATRKRAIENNLSNVVPVENDFLVEGCGRPDNSAGYAMLFNILHIEEPVKLLNEAFRVLAPGGRLGIIHWKHDPQTPRGPNLDIRPTPELCRTWAESAGFRFVRSEELCCCAWHWGLVLDRPGNHVTELSQV